MKNIIAILLLLLTLPSVFACVRNSIEVYTPVNFTNLGMALFFNSRYNLFDNYKFYYFSLRDPNVQLKVSNTSVTLKMANILDYNSTLWSNVVRTELVWLNSVNATNFSVSEIATISEQGCCGTYNSTEFTLGNGCTETFEIPIIDNKLTWVLILLPPIIILVLAYFFGRFKINSWIAFLIGCGGWSLALFLRGFIINSLSINILGILLSSVLAGIFEEVVRYLIMKYSEKTRKDPFMFGLGWGFAEAVLLFTLNIAVILLFNQVIFAERVVPGVLERFMSTALHVSYTVILLKALIDKRYLLLAIFMHFVTDFAAGLAYYILGFDVWISEGIILIFTILVAIIAYNVNREVFSFVKKFGRKSKKVARR